MADFGGFKVSAQVGDIGPILDSIEDVTEKLRNRWLKKAVTKADQILAKAAKGTAPVESGLLKKSIGHKVVVYKSGIVVGLVGPRKGFKMAVVVAGGQAAIADTKKGQKLLKAGGKTMFRDPVRYAHLVELGTSKNPANPFLRRALESSRQAMYGAMADSLRADINTYRSGAK